MPELRSAVSEYMGRQSLAGKLANPIPGIGYFGTLTAYNPFTGQVKCNVFFAGNAPHDTGWIQLMTPAAGTSYGDQFVPEIGAQVVVLAISGSDHFVALGFTFTKAKLPPNSALKTGEQEITSKGLGRVRVTNDGKTSGDNLGGAALIVPSGGAVGVGDTAANIFTASGNTAKAIANAHMTTFEGSLLTQRLADMVTLVQTLISTASITNTAAALSAVQALTLSHISVPTGAPSVFIKQT